jgi:hypothetical protein
MYSLGQKWLEVEWLGGRRPRDRLQDVAVTESREHAPTIGTFALDSRPHRCLVSREMKLYPCYLHIHGTARRNYPPKVRCSFVRRILRLKRDERFRTFFTTPQFVLSQGSSIIHG